MSGDCRSVLATPFGDVVASVGITGDGGVSLTFADRRPAAPSGGRPPVDRVVGFTAELTAFASCRFRASLRLVSPREIRDFGPHSGEWLECVIHEGDAGAIALATRDGDWLAEVARWRGRPRSVADDDRGAMVDARGPDLVVDLPAFEAGETFTLAMAVAWTTGAGRRDERTFAVWEAADRALPGRPNSNER